jgi:hypothetical protein
MHFVAGCQNTDKRPALTEEINALRREKRDLARQIEKAKLENKDLKKQIQVLSGLPSGVKPESLYRLQSIKITKYTDFYDKDKDGKKEKLIVYIQPIDEDGGCGCPPPGPEFAPGKPATSRTVACRANRTNKALVRRIYNRQLQIDIRCSRQNRGPGRAIDSECKLYRLPDRQGIQRRETN